MFPQGKTQFNSDSFTPLRLSERLFISQGRERACYRHPQNPSLVVKVPLNDRNSPANRHEMKGYLLLCREGADLSFFSHCRGFVDTDRGLGLLCDCACDADGSISRTIWDTVLFQDDCDIAHILEITREFCDYLIANRIWIFDINAKNIVLKKRRDGSLHPCIIDLKGRYDNKEFIPLSRYFDYLSLRKLQRRSRQLLHRVADLHEKRAEVRLQDHPGH